MCQVRSYIRERVAFGDGRRGGENGGTGEDVLKDVRDRGGEGGCEGHGGVGEVVGY